MTTIREQYGLRDAGKVDVGIEIEVEGKRLPEVVPGGWRAHMDGSLRGESMEYVLHNPAPARKVEYYLNQLMECFEENESTINDSDNTGVHIHINCQWMTTEQVLKFACLYLMMEEILVSMCGKNRAGNLFCLRARDAEGLIYRLCEAKRAMNLNGLQSDLVRYSSLNMAALSKFGTLEFRAMRTPNDFRKLEEWINILITIRDASGMFDKIEDMVEGVSRQGAKRFLTLIFGQDKADQIWNHNCEDMLLRGVRLVQDIAYTPTVLEDPDFDFDEAIDHPVAGVREFDVDQWLRNAQRMRIAGDELVRQRVDELNPLPVEEEDLEPDDEW